MKLFNSIMKRAIDRDTAQNLGFNRIMIAQFYALKLEPYLWYMQIGFTSLNRDWASK